MPPKRSPRASGTATTRASARSRVLRSAAPVVWLAQLVQAMSSVCPPLVKTKTKSHSISQDLVVFNSLEQI